MISLPRLTLLVLPLAVLALLFQSALWVPSYNTVGANNPERLRSFVETSIGDARLLNPILVADTASARISDLVFDGLLRIDEQLQLSAGLATRWTLEERAWLTLDNGVDPQRAAQRVQELLTRIDPQLLKAPLRVHPAHTTTRTFTPDGADQPVRVTVSWPVRLELYLSRVEPQLATLIEPQFKPRISTAARRARLHAEGVSFSDEQVDLLLPEIEHNPQIEFQLRNDVQFHDGHAFDSDDVVFTWQAIMDARNRSPHRASFEPIKDVIAVTPHTVRVVYKRLFSPAVNVWTMGILPEHLLNAKALEHEMQARTLSDEARKAFGMRDAAFNRQPVGTGSFQFERWESDELIHLQRNSAHHRGAPLWHDYWFRIIPDTLTQEVEFRTGAADTYQAEPHQAARYRKDKAFRAFSTITPGYTYIGYNQRKAPFNDLRVRKALGMAIDVESIIRYTLFNEGERVTGPFASITRWYDKSVSPLAFDLAGATALLQQAGWSRDSDGWMSKDGKRLEFNLITNNGNLRRKAIATIVQQAWRKIGVKCNVQLFEWAVFLKDFINPGRFDAVVLGWSMGLDPDLYQLWHSSQSGPNDLNFVGFKDNLADELIKQLRREYDEDAQITLAHQLHRRIADLQPYTFLFAPRSTRLLDRKIVMLDAANQPQVVRAGGAGNLFYHMNRWQRLAHDPGF